MGRPAKLKEAQVDVLARKVEVLTRAADAKFQVTVGMLKKAAGLKCCNRVILDALHSRGIYLRPMREKPLRTEEDEVP